MLPVTDHPHLVHALFEAAALSLGTFHYRQQLGSAGTRLTGGRLAVAIGCILGAALGNKLVFWIEVPHLLPLYWNSPAAWLAGQSLVGGLLGGLIGVESAKKAQAIRESTGDAFVFPILLGIIIGRIGCFLAGLDDGTFGVPTTTPFGVDFGDGIPRHPTQLYEIVFAALLWPVLRRMQSRWAMQPGLLFKAMLSAYLAWRLLIDGLKPLPFDYGLGMSGIQWLCLLALAAYTPLLARQWWKLETTA